MSAGWTYPLSVGCACPCPQGVHQVPLKTLSYYSLVIIVIEKVI
jgi:hypothetical protein